MHICWVINGDEMGGDAQMVRGLAGRVSEAGLDVTILSLVPGRFHDECRDRGFNAISLGLGKFPGLSGGILKSAIGYRRAAGAQRRAVPAIAKAAKDVGADILHTTWPNFLTAVGEAAQTNGQRCIWEVQNILSARYPFGLNRRIIQAVLKKYNYTVLAMGSMVADSLGWKPVAPELFYLGADERRFQPVAADLHLRAELGIPSDASVLGMFVRLVPEKGCDRVLEAAAGLRARHPELHVLIVGGPHDTAYGAKIRSMSESNELHGAVHLVAFTPVPERYYGAIDMVASVRSAPEPFGLAVVEAMLMEKPVLVNPLGGPAETIIDGFNGWHLAGAEPGHIADGITRALVQRGSWKAMGAAGRNRAIAQFSLQRQTELYLRLIGAPQCAPAAPSAQAAAPRDCKPELARVAWIISGDEIGGGVAQTVRGLTSTIKDRGITPVIVSLISGCFTGELARRGMEVWNLRENPPPALHGGVLRKMLQQFQVLMDSRRLASKLTRMLRQTHVDAVHVVWPNLMFAAALSARRLGIACIWEMPNTLSPYPFDLNRRLLQAIMKRLRVTCVANSRFTAESIGEHPVKPVVIHPGGDAQRFRPMATDAISRDEIGIPAGHAVFAVVGRITPQKGQLRAIRGFAALVKRYPAARLLLIGGAKDLEYLGEMKSLIKVAGLEKNVYLIGEVAAPERYYGVVDVAVSLHSGSEAFGLSVVEAMLAGKPVLAHALGGPSETVVDGVTGWLIRDVSDDAVLEGFERVMADRELWPKMGEASRDRALANYTLELQRERYEALVRRLLAEG